MFRRLLPGLGLLVAATTMAQAATFCVTDSIGFQAALDSAATNGQDDVIKVTEGFYAPSSLLDFQSTESKSISIEGGYQTTAQGPCSGRVKRPNLTVLDGGDLRPLLHVTQLGAMGDVVLRDLTIQHGLAVNDVVPLLLGAFTPWEGRLTVERLIVRENRSTTFCAIFLSGTGETSILNVAFVNNETSGASSALEVNSWPAGVVPVAVTNITVTGNRVFPIGSPAHAISLAGLDTEFVLSNNIIWGNAGTDLRTSSGLVSLVNSDIGSICCYPPMTSTGSISVNPGFLASNDHRLSGSSPARDAGINNPAGYVGSFDVNGAERIVFGTVDMGAYEIQDEVFANGFD